MKIKCIWLLALFVLLRLPFIANPYTDYISQRQVPCADIAKNFAEKRLNILYPQYSTNGGKEGYIEIELQILPFMVALLYKVFGFHEIFGRLAALAFSALGFYVLHRLLLLLQLTGRQRLYILAIYILLPQHIYLSRSFMPEPVMLTFMLLFLYFSLAYHRSGKALLLVPLVLSGALMVLAKAPALYMVLCLAPLLFWFNGYLRGRWLLTALLLAAMLVLPVLYYGHMYRIGKRYSSVGIWEPGRGHISKWATWDTLTSRAFIGSLAGRLFSFTITPVLLPFFLLGLCVLTRRDLVFLFFLLGVAASWFILAKGTIANPYYLFPFAPVVAYFAGLGLERLGRVAHLAYFPHLILAIALLYGTWYGLDLYVADQSAPAMGRVIARYLEPGDKLLTALHSTLYYSGHDGFLRRTLAPRIINTYRGKGAGWLLYPLLLRDKLNKARVQKIRKLCRYYRLVVQTEDFLLFNLHKRGGIPPRLDYPRTLEQPLCGKVGTKSDCLRFSLCVSCPDGTARFLEVERQGRRRALLRLVPGRRQYSLRMPAHPHLHTVCLRAFPADASVVLERIDLRK